MRARVILHLILITGGIQWIGCDKNARDDQIQKNIQAKAAADPDTKGSEVTVFVKNGRVTLTGKVKSEEAGKKLEKIAETEPGVSEVEDQTWIQTGDSSTTAPVSAAPNTK